MVYGTFTVSTQNQCNRNRFFMTISSLRQRAYVPFAVSRFTAFRGVAVTRVSVRFEMRERVHARAACDVDGVHWCTPRSHQL